MIRIGRRKVGLEMTTIRVPKELRDSVKSTARRMKLPMWQLLHQAFAYYRMAYLSHFTKNSSDIGKIAWYAYKLSASIGEFRANPTKENGNMLAVTATQIAERLGVDINMLKTAVIKYQAQPTQDNRILLNDAGKDVVAQLLTLLTKESKNE
mgnify:CR=1 FL=1